MPRVGLALCVLLAAAPAYATPFPVGERLASTTVRIQQPDPAAPDGRDAPIVERGPPPRVVAEMRPPTTGGPPRAELRSRPPDGYAAVEEVEVSTPPRRVPWLRYALIAFGLTAVGYWALRRNRPDPAQGT